MSSYDNYCRIQKIAGEAAAKGGFSPAGVRVLAVTKNQSADVSAELHNCGIKEFAENRIHVLEEKAKILPQDIVWHFIGKIQSNKVRKIIKIAKVLHSVDSSELLSRIDRISGEEGVSPEIFIEVNVSGEASKSGINISEVNSMLSIPLKHAKVCGLMTMAPFDSTEDEQKAIFSALKKCAEANGLTELSMGMTNDFQAAAECGSTILRIGTALFE